ncbi:MAG: hypothetical protein QNJ69_12385 [Gammaproteobacteria bacterium]|nr:hypothetical protein [Gammaproteobacteria bacterium]
MQISGNTLPVLSNQSTISSRQDGTRQRPVEEVQRYADNKQQTHKQTVEYVFKGEVLEDAISEHRQKPGYQQNIDPTNRSAISSYTATDELSPYYQARQGRLLDIFI